MQRTVLVRGARQLITLLGPPGARRGAAMRDLGIVQDGAVLIVDGTIREVGPSRRVEKLAAARDAIEIDASGKVVMPGFVDCHTQPVAGAAALDEYERQCAGEVAAPEALLDNVKQVRTYSKQRMELEARKQIRQFIRHGTTTLDARSGVGLDEASELKLLRTIEALDGKPLAVSAGYSGGCACPREYAGQADEYVDWLMGRMLPAIRDRRLARFVDVSCATEGGFTPRQAGRLLLYAVDLGFFVRVAAGPGADGAVAAAVEYGAAAVDGLIEVSPAEVAALASSAAVAVLLPGRTFQAGSTSAPPARALIDGGATVALATGFDSWTSPSCSMAMMLSLACTQMRMSPAESITAATVNAAYALRIEDRVGSLEAGKDGDLIVLGCGDYREIPFRFGMNPVAMVLRRGEPIFPRMGPS